MSAGRELAFVHSATKADLQERIQYLRATTKAWRALAVLCATNPKTWKKRLPYILAFVLNPIGFSGTIEDLEAKVETWVLEAQAAWDKAEMNKLPAVRW